MPQSRKAEWALVIGALIVSMLLWFGRGRSTDMQFEDAVAFTIVPSDREDLACSAGARAGALGCAFDEGGARVDVPPEKMLQPFVTLDGRVVLLAGVFEQKLVHDWWQRSTQNGESLRATIDCQMANRATVAGAKIRWKTSGPWAPQAMLSAAAVVECTVR